MKNVELNKTLIDSYFGLLRNLSHEVRIELIARLSNSLSKKDKKNKKDFFSLFGSYKSDKSADQIIQDIKSGRMFTRKTEEL